MKLLEALAIIKSAEASATGPSFRVLLATGYTQLPLEIMLKAHLFQNAPDKRISIVGGLFGDLVGNLERASDMDAVAAVIEWEDLDPRLGVRTLGGWTAGVLPDILRTVRMQTERIAAALKNIAVPVALSMPTLPFPPASYVSPQQISGFEAEVRIALLQLAAGVGANVRVLNPYRLDAASAVATRFDVQAAITSGFPFSTAHVASLSSQLASLLLPLPVRKGLITDLDDTVWAGILGEAGIQGVRWDLDGKAQIHGLYQQFLMSLASAGVLVGVASKNEAALVEKVFSERTDMLLNSKNVFPVEANWGPKSESVANILKAWNIGARDVVFVDDSPMEVAEVQAAFPEMECLVFPKKSPVELWQLLHKLRETFAKAAISSEDELRLASLRAAGEFRQEASTGSVSEQFLSGAEAEITIRRDKEPDARAFELINKTNQFNLNGIRLTESEWNALLAHPESFLCKVAYRDRFGPLGSIAVAAGYKEGSQLRIHHWVMSCRAFSRRIEHQTLKLLFESFDVNEIVLSWLPTPLNAPTRKFLESLVGTLLEEQVVISRATFVEKCPALYHAVQDSWQQSQTTNAG